MPEDKTQLQKAFEECGEQLDRIADALKRKNGPFVPTGLPCYLKISNILEDQWAIQKINSITLDPPTVNSEEIIETHNIEAVFVIGVIGSASNFVVNFYMDENIATIDFSTFAIELNNQNYSVEWVDPSIL